MNSTPRTATRGGTKSKSEATATASSGKAHTGKKDGKKDTKSNDQKPQPATHNPSHAVNSVRDEKSFKEKINNIMSIIPMSEDEIMTALHDCDNDTDKAVSMLLEGEQLGVWETSGKKKKNRQAAGGAKGGEPGGGRSDGDGCENESQPLAPNQDRERSRGRGGAGRSRGRGGGPDGRGPGRGRENNKENEGGEDSRGGYRRGGRGMANGGRGGRGGRGGGGRLGTRTFQPRDKSAGDRFPSTIDTWNPAGTQDTADKGLKMETWGDEKFPTAEDWDNEEYTGSLADTKVFTPSSLETCVVGPDLLDDTPNHHIFSAQLPSSPLPTGVGTLDPAQLQYMNQLTQQSAENHKLSSATNYGQTESLKNAVDLRSYGQASSYGQQSGYTSASYGQTSNSGYGAAANSYQSSTTFPSSSTGTPAYSSGYQNTGASSFGVYGSSGVTYDTSASAADSTAPASQQPARAKPQRARVPPPSKIPSSAVEMPEDSISASVSSLDVQFGGLEFGDNTSFEQQQQQPVEQPIKYQQPSTTPASVATDTSSTGAASTVLETPSSQQVTLDSYTSASNVSSNAAQQSSLGVSSLSKGLTSNESLTLQSATEHKSSYNTQSTRPVATTSALDLNKSEVGLSYASAPSATSYGSYPSQKAGSYQQQSYSTPSSYSTASFNSQQTVTNAFPSSSYNSQPVSGTAVNYASGGGYPSANSFQNSSQSYQTASVYGSGLGGYSATYPSSASYSSGKVNAANLGTSKDSTDAAASSISSSSTSSTIPNSGLSSSTLVTTPQSATTSSSAKVSTAQMKGSVVPSMHPQLMGAPQYIMSQGPFYQSPIYGFEDVLVHPRMPHMPAGYYDVGFTAPTSLATRDSLANVAYTADARYSTRGDNNASPVPSTLSQQTATAAHQQPMMNPSFPPGYAWYPVPGSYQYSAPLYPVPSGSAHGTSSNQYGKPASYGSTYGSAYDGLSQTADYSKSAYASGAGATGKVTVSAASTATDLYGKPHTALGKVNSFDKQAFHSGTPPPFNLAGGQTTGIAPSGAYAPPLFIPTMAHQQQHLMQPHLQDSSSNSGQRSQSGAQPNKTATKQAYNAYWTTN